jgi:hypothetical protein
LKEIVLRLEELWDSGSGGMHAARAYWNALAKLRAAWREVYGDDLPTHGNMAKDAFEQAIALMKQRLAQDAAGGRRLRDALDVEAKEDIAEVLLGYADMDDLPPAAVKQALLDECRRLGTSRVEVRDLLRPVLDALFKGETTRRPRIGANRHWPRLLQYLRELQEETDWRPDGRGMAIVNSGGRGPVARNPRDPALLAIRIDADYL